MLTKLNVFRALQDLDDNDLNPYHYFILMADSKNNEVVEKPLKLMIDNYASLKKELEEKGYITEKGYHTKKARDITGLSSNTGNFDEFWKAYPTSDKWGSYKKTRTLRLNKKKTLVEYNKALQEYTHEELMGALSTDLSIRKKSSSIRNSMSYLPIIHRWLSGKYYEAILEDLGESDNNSTSKLPRYEGDIQ
jgi:hypothetical protein